MDGNTIGRTSQRRDSADTSDDHMAHDETGAVTATYSQDAFGNVLAGTPDGFHLTTKRHYSAIGLYYFYMRWYDPVSGIFMQDDPLGAYLTVIYKSHEALYNFCGNNPITYIDPSDTKKDAACLGRCRTEFIDCMQGCQDTLKDCWLGCSAICTGIAKPMCMRVCLVGCGSAAIACETKCTSAWLGCKSGCPDDKCPKDPPEDWIPPDEPPTHHTPPPNYPWPIPGLPYPPGQQGFNSI